MRLIIFLLEEIQVGVNEARADPDMLPVPILDGSAAISTGEAIGVLPKIDFNSLINVQQAFSHKPYCRPQSKQNISAIQLVE